MDLQPHLVGEWIELRPLRPNDWDELFGAACDPKIWEQHPARDRWQEEVFREYFQGALDSRGAFAVIDRKTGCMIGSTRFCGYDPGQRQVEIGWTFLARSHWGGQCNGEMKRLLLDHAFKFVDRVVFLVGAENHRSRRALEKIGAVLAGRLEKRDHRGQAIEHVVYQIIKPGLCWE